jgi:hypothetical protein
MTTINPDGKTTYSHLIRNGLGEDKPAPHHVTLKDGTVLLNDWIIKRYTHKYPLRKGQTFESYTVMNWVNIIDDHGEETYSYSELDSENTIIRSGNILSNAYDKTLAKMQELKTRDRIPAAWVKCS